MQRKSSFLALVGALLVILLTPFSQSIYYASEPTRTPPVLNEKGEGEVLTGAWPRALAEDDMGYVWVASGFDNTVQRVDEHTGKIWDDPIKVGTQPTSLAWLSATKTMWVSSYDDASITPVVVNAEGKAVAGQPFNLGDSRPVGMAVAGGNLWIITQVRDSDISKDNLIKFDPASRTILSRLTVGRFPTAIVNSFSSVNPDDRLLFVANGHDDSVSVVDTRADGGKGKVTATYTEGIPAFPFSLVFDGTYLWVGSYECVYDNEKCAKSSVGRLSIQTGQPAPAVAALPGRQVFVSFSQGHVWTANGHGEGVADVNSVSAEATRKIMQKPQSGRDAYFGVVLQTREYVYVADWTNDRLLRFLSPARIDVPPTPTALPPTATFLPTFTPSPLPPCNPDPKFPARLQPGQRARVINDDFKKPLNIRKEPNFEDGARTGKLFVVGDEFDILEGPVGNNKALDPKTNPDASCFYKVKGVKDDSMTGYVTEGGLASDGKNKRYYIEALK